MDNFKPKTIPFAFWGNGGIADDAPFLEDVIKWFRQEYRRYPTLREIAICVWYSYYKLQVVPYMLQSPNMTRLSVYHFFLHKFGLTPQQVDKLPIDFVVYVIEKERKLAESGASSYNQVRGAPIG